MPSFHAITPLMNTESTMPFGPIHHLLVTKDLAVFQFASLVRLPAIECIRVNEHHIGLRPNLECADIKPKDLGRLRGQALHHTCHRGFISFLGELERHQVGIKERHIGNVRAGVIEAGQGLLIEQEAQRGGVVFVGNVGVKPKAFVVGAHHVQHKVSVVAQYLGEQIKGFALGVGAARGTVATW